MGVSHGEAMCDLDEAFDRNLLGMDSREKTVPGGGSGKRDFGHNVLR